MLESEKNLVGKRLNLLPFYVNLLKFLLKNMGAWYKWLCEQQQQSPTVYQINTWDGINGLNALNGTLLPSNYPYPLKKYIYYMNILNDIYIMDIL